MLHSRIDSIEREIRDGSLSAEFETKKFAIDIPDEPNQKLEGLTIRPKNGYTGYYYAEKKAKDKIVLHFTAGYLKSDLRALMDPNRGHVSTNFVLGRDGTIYQLFSSGHWSYHLGRGAKGGNGKQSSRSIGIEISNFGYLVPKGDELHTIYGRAFCKMSDESLYYKLDEPFRGQTYYAGYPEAQINSLIVLLRYLTKSYKIPTEYLPEDQRFITTDAVVPFQGIVSHINYRESGKWDLGPAFPWQKVMDGLKADTFEIPKSRGGFGFGMDNDPEITSESALTAEFPTGADNEFKADQYGEDGPSDEMDRGLVMENME